MIVSGFDVVSSFVAEEHTGDEFWLLALANVIISFSKHFCDSGLSNSLFVGMFLSMLH